MKFSIPVEIYMYSLGNVEVEARTKNEAINIVSNRIASGDLMASGVEWGDPTDEEGTFCVSEEEEEDDSEG